MFFKHRGFSLYTMIKKLYDIYQQCTTICTDTRKIEQGGLFFALRGESFNGNAFAQKAVDAGCSYAIIDEEKYKNGDRFILVPDALEALQQLAMHHRAQLNIPVIGITGSNGKTTTKELLASVLEQQFQTYATSGNFNNHIGVPLSVLGIKKHHEIAIIEMGANHQGEIGFLCEIAQPAYGIITNIGKAHLEGFGGIEGVIAAKRQLYDFIKGVDGTLFINKDNPLLLELAEGIKQISYGTGTNADIHGSLRNDSFMLKLDWKKGNETISIATKLVGGYNFENAMAAVTLGDHFGLNADQIRTGLETYEPSNNRSQLTQKGQHTLILDAYNANPTSMSASISNFSTLEQEHKWVILGDMLELGDYSLDEHQAIVTQLQEAKFEKVILVGPEFQRTTCPEHFERFTTVNDLLPTMQHLPSAETHFLVKGSRGIKLEKVVKAFESI